MQNYVDYSPYIIYAYSVSATLLVGLAAIVSVKYCVAKKKNEK